VALIGHGLGALVAMLFAAKHAYVVDRLMVISLPMTGEGLLDWAGGLSPVELANRLLDQKPNGDAARTEAAKSDQNAILCTLEELGAVDVLGLCRQIAPASLLVHGIKDPVNPATDLSENSNLPSMTHHISFEESGHFPMLDQPNKFNRLMKDFLDLPSGESPRQLQLKDEWKRRVR
jgi:pimeloyl-ACP methyl ester carboxylesterase